MALYLWDKIRNDFIGNSLRKRNIYQVLFSELSILEEAFSDYLKREVEVASAKTNGRDYPSSSTHLLKRLLSDGRPDPEACGILEHVLSFNYTRPYCEMPTADEHGNVLSTAVSLINVHGSLKEDDIIIGIDGKDCMSVPEAARFTKTFRVMGLESMRADSPSWIPLGNGAPSIDIIKFYGHSLSEADYSFFQALFDSVDLYGGNTRLAFYFKPHGKKSADVASDNLRLSVSRLLATYGATLDNKDHGKNLQHKLLMERRLAVKDVRSIRVG